MLSYGVKKSFLLSWSIFVKKTPLNPSLLLQNKLREHKAHIAIIGLGYVGLPLAVAFAHAGFTTSGIDVDTKRIQSLNKGKNYIDDISEKMFKQVFSSGRISFHQNFNSLQQADVIIICVPTPLRKTQDPDISYIIAACTEVKKHLHQGQLIILESTTYPGTTEEIMQVELEKDGFQVGRDFFLAFSPERIDPGNPKFQLENTPKIVGGITPVCTDLAAQLYALIVQQVHPVSNPKTAEMVKLLENTFRSVNIGLVNEIAIICKHLGIDTWEVIQAAATKPFGFMPFYPGPGLGGHCIPIDPHYLAWKLRSFNYRTRFIELASEVNESMGTFVVQMAQNALNQKSKPIHKTKLLLMGVAYKKNVSDTRESPAYEIYKQLHRLGAHIDYYDPHVATWMPLENNLSSITLTPSQLKKYAMVIIITNHDNVDYEFLVKNSKLVIDTRNATQGIKSPKIIKL